MNERRLSCTNPICDSMVIRWSLRVRLMRSTNALSSVDLPLARAPGDEHEAVRLLAERLHFRRQRRADRPRSPAAGTSGKARPGRDDP